MTDNNNYVAEDATLTSATVTLTASSPAEAFTAAMQVVEGWATRRGLATRLDHYEIHLVQPSLSSTGKGKYEVRMS